MKSTSVRQMVDEALASQREALSSLKREKEALAEAQERYQDAKEAQEHIQKLAEAVQNKAHKEVARVVSRCLTAVFGEEYRLRIEFERKRGKTEANFSYLKEGFRDHPRQSSGGVMVVTAFALRLTSMLMSLPPGRRLMILDEPLQGLTSENLQKMGRLIELLAKELEIQFILATHNQELNIGKVIRV